MPPLYVANLQEGSQSLSRPMHLIDSFTAIEHVDVLIEPVESKYSFSVINVGQGSLQLIEEGDRINIVIDCNLQAAPEFVVRYFGRREVKQIDLLILSGTDADHADADGLEFLKKNWEIKRLWYPDFQKDEETDNWKKVRKMISELQD